MYRPVSGSVARRAGIGVAERRLKLV